MNLQVCVPYEKCPFKCPTCIANGRELFENLYDSDLRKYEDSLYKTIHNSKIDNCIITGNTEPTLNRHWLRDVLYILRNKQTELQTRNYNLKGYNLKYLNVLAYSITDVRSYLKSWNFRKIKGVNRLVILLTKEFDFLTAENFNTMGFEQITFKVLQPTADETTNKYIEKNRMTDLTEIYRIIERFNGSNVSVRIDTNCQDSENRYRVFREDGKLYRSWESVEPIER